MDQANSLISGAVGSALNKRSTPAVGEKLLLHCHDWSPNLHEVLEGSPMSPNGTYVEVEVRAVKKAKVILE
jgi:hypothetical protein